ncbi:hypothetical protein DdX_12126 [Ditylenchus destructor]|uniref:Integrator complex subunit 14 n=1 Tax=Ditylenchus destructor TaxID=166010 RepID=A0AAD4MYR8_9BILA|nr:hypothetical protein DdX_12126 [Ditylenchus destructor]
MHTLYIAIDCSLSAFVDKQPHGAKKKLQLALDFAGELVDRLDKSDLDISLIALTSRPKIICENAKNAADVTASFSSVHGDNCVPNFVELRDLILQRHKILNFELIIVRDAAHYLPISDSFRLPCIVKFIALSNNRTHDPRILAEFETISTACAADAKLLRTLTNEQLKPGMLYDNASMNSLVDSLVSLSRTTSDVSLSISPTTSIEVNVVPGLPKPPFLILENEELLKKLNDDMKGSSAQLQLLGFVKSASLLCLPRTSMLHIIRIKDLSNEKNKHDFHLFAEALGSEGQVAVFMHSSGEECIVKPLRDDINDPWMLCLQFYPSGHFRWEPEGCQTEKAKIQFSEEKGVSYKVSNSRTYWTDSHGIQSDILKINRLLKRSDRIEQFYQEIQRIALYAIACGYDDPPTCALMADLIMKRCSNAAPENRGHLAKIIETLKVGGFRQLLPGKL